MVAGCKNLQSIDIPALSLFQKPLQDQCNRAINQRERHQNAEYRFISLEQFLQFYTGEQPGKVAQRSGKREKSADCQQRQKILCIGKDKRRKRRHAEYDDFDIGQLNKQPGPERRFSDRPILFMLFRKTWKENRPDHIPGHLQKVSCSCPGKVSDMRSQHIPQESIDQYAAKRNERKTSKQTSPLPQSSLLSFVHSGRKRAEIRWPRGNAVDETKRQKGRQESNRHTDHLLQRSLITSPAIISPTTDGTKAVEPGISLRTVHFRVPGGQMQCFRQLMEGSSSGWVGCSVE